MIKIFFEYDGEVIQLPVNPEEFRVVSEGNNVTQEIIKIGEINILKLPKLATLSISSFFPIDEDAPYVLTKGANFKTPKELLNFFRKPYKALRPVNFSTYPGTANKNSAFSIERFETFYVAGDDDTHYVMDLKDYKNYGKKTYKTDFNVPEDDDGMLKVSLTSYRPENLILQAELVSKNILNKIKMVSRYAGNAQRAVNTIRSTGSIINVARNL